MDSLWVLLQPDRTFCRVLVRRDIVAASVTMGIGTSIGAVGVMALFKLIRVPSLVIPVKLGAEIVLGSWTAGMFLCWTGSILLDAVYGVALTVNGQPLASDRRGHGCARACITPWWLLFFCLLAWLPLPRVSFISLVVIIAAALRLLDLEARLLAHVYQLPLMQAYVVVLTEAIFIIIGVMLGMRLPSPPALPMPRMSSPLPLQLIAPR